MGLVISAIKVHEKYGCAKAAIEVSTPSTMAKLTWPNTRMVRAASGEVLA